MFVKFIFEDICFTTTNIAETVASPQSQNYGVMKQISIGAGPHFEVTVGKCLTILLDKVWYEQLLWCL